MRGWWHIIREVAECEPRKVPDHHNDEEMLMDDGRYEDDHCDGDNYNAEDKRMKLIMTRKIDTHSTVTSKFPILEKASESDFESHIAL
jgi:hypothetical protein